MLVALLLGAGVGDDRAKWLVGIGVKIGKQIKKTKTKQTNKIMMVLILGEYLQSTMVVGNTPGSLAGYCNNPTMIVGSTPGPLVGY